MAIGGAIKTVREKRGMTQQGLAEKARISQGFLSLVERGGRQPSFNMTKRLSRALGLPVELLLLVGADTQRSKRYAKQLRRISSLAIRIVDELASQGR